MGGGGGGGLSHRNPEETVRRLEQSKRDTENEVYSARASALLDDKLTSFNNRDTAAIQKHLDEILRALGRDVTGSVDLRFAGSVAKHTWVDGLSDIDSLVMLDKCELAEQTPQAAKDYLDRRIKERFPKTEISQGTLAVTVKFADVDVQLLPAVSCEGAVKIPSEDGRSWARIKPQEFTRVLSEVNQAKGNKVVPVVKLAKAIIANLPDPHRISGYHTESLGVEVFRNYDGPLRTKEMLKHFFTEATPRLLRPIVDRTGQSVHVDDALGAPNSTARQVISDAFDRVARKMNKADASETVEVWRDLFGD
jgi:hypothetical protein